jgi:hypothetical protein
VLKAALHDDAYMLVRPTREQNSDSLHQDGDATDPQQPAAVEDLCVRMGLERPAHLEPRMLPTPSGPQ